MTAEARFGRHDSEIFTHTHKKVFQAKSVVACAAPGGPRVVGVCAPIEVSEVPRTPGPDSARSLAAVSAHLVFFERLANLVSQPGLTRQRPLNKMDAKQAEGMSAKKFADKAIRALEKRKKEVYIGKKEVLMVYIKRYIPILYYYLIRKVSVR